MLQKHECMMGLRILHLNEKTQGQTAVSTEQFLKYLIMTNDGRNIYWTMWFSK
jgi:hypothetical protein